MKRIIRYSEIRAFQRCRRKWLNGYVLGLRLPEFDGEYEPKIKRDAGTLVHADLERYYNGDSPVPGVWLKTQDPTGGTFAAEWSKVFDLAQIMLDGYAQWLLEEGFDQGERTHGTEVEVDVPMGAMLGDEVVLRVHIDRIVEDLDFGGFIIEDTKTVDSIDKDSSFDIDWQLRTYVLAARDILGLNVIAARHNMLRRVKRTARATPPFYARTSVILSDEILASHERALRGVLTDIIQTYHDLENGGVDYVAYPNPTKDCSWDCDFLPICAMHDDGSDLSGVRETLYIKREA